MKNLAYLQIIHTNGNERQRSVAEILKILGSTTSCSVSRSKYLITAKIKIPHGHFSAHAETEIAKRFRSAYAGAVGTEGAGGGSGGAASSAPPGGENF